MNDVFVDPRRLELLLELSRLGSMREVGEAMHVTTSTVSQQIAALSREAGTPLTEPEGRRVRLTPAGRRLAGHAVTILAAIEAARRDLDPAAPARARAGRGPGPAGRGRDRPRADLRLQPRAGQARREPARPAAGRHP